MTVNTAHLQTLLAVMQTGSFSAAAALMGFVPSTVTQHIAALEQHVGSPLFTRSASSVKPTAKAFLLASQASRVLTDLQAMSVKSVDAQRPQGGTLRLGIFPSLAARTLPRVLKDPRWNDIGVELQVSVAEPWETAEQIRSGIGLDLALVFQVGEAGVPWPANVVREYITADPFNVVVPTAWGVVDGEEMRLADLAARPWIMHFPGGSDGLVIEEHLRNLRFHPPVVAFCDDFSATPDLVAAGLGAALLPELSSHRIDGCARVRVPELQLHRNILALTHRGRETDNVRALINLFKEASRKS